MNERSILQAIKKKSIPAIAENENLVTFFPGGKDYDNVHQIPEWAYRNLLSDIPFVDKADKESDYLRVRIGYRDGQSASTIISRNHDLQRRIYIEAISFTPRAQLTTVRHAVIVDIMYAKDNLDSLLYVLQDTEVEILEPVRHEYITVER